MPLPHPAQSAYARPDAVARSPRAVEYDLFARVTRAIAQATRGDPAKGGRPDHPALIRALYDNGRLWRVLAADVADPQNGLPPRLRAQLFYLHEFTAAHSRKVLDGSAAAGVLVDINTAVMRGLRGEGGSA